MLVRDIMTTDVVTVGPRTTVREAAHLLVGHRFTALPVIGPDDDLVGVVTESDLAPLRRHDARSPELAIEMATTPPTHVGEVATPEPVRPDIPVDVRTHSQKVSISRGTLSESLGLGCLIICQTSVQTGDNALYMMQ